jgi:hypothetical protein
MVLKTSQNRSIKYKGKYFPFVSSCLRSGVKLEYLGFISNHSDDWFIGEAAFLVLDDRKKLGFKNDIPFDEYVWDKINIEEKLRFLTRFDLDEVSGSYLNSYQHRRNSNLERRKLDPEQKYLTFFLK